MTNIRFVKIEEAAKKRVLLALPFSTPPPRDKKIIL